MVFALYARRHRSPPSLSEQQLRQGDVVAFPRGKEGAHQIRNDTDAPVRVLMLSTLIAPDIVECVTARQVLAPPDIERAVGLSGGHIFQGECLPDQMWDRRFSPRTPMPGLYMCGASTHPGGSVMAINGRNCAMAVLADTDGSRG